MAVLDPHDPRPFRRYVQFNADGSVASEHDFEAGAVCPLLGAVEVTDLVPLDLTAIAITPAEVATLRAAVDDHDAKSAAVEKAVVDLTTAAAALQLVLAATRGSLAVSAGKVNIGPAPISPVVTG